MNDTLPGDIASADPITTFAALLRAPQITREDVATLRGSSLSTGLLGRAQAELMLAIEQRSVPKCREWGQFLVECLADYVLWGERPTGVLTEAQATWLTDQVGDTPTTACLALLIAVHEEATTTPPWFGVAVRVRAARVFGRTDLAAARKAA